MIAALLLAVIGADVDPEPPPRKVTSVSWYDLRHGPPLQRDHRVLRSAADLVEALPDLSDRSATPKAIQQTATDEAAKALGVKSIDWKKQMLVVIAAGGQRS